METHGSDVSAVCLPIFQSLIPQVLHLTCSEPGKLQCPA